QIRPPLVIQRFFQAFYLPFTFITCPKLSVSIALLSCCFPDAVLAVQKPKNWAWSQGCIPNLSYLNRHWQWRPALIATAQKSFVLDEHLSSRPAKAVI